MTVCMGPRILRKHGCPPDEQEKATRTALERAYTPDMHPIRSSVPPAPAGLMRRRAAIRLAAALPWLVLAAGCGQKGPLYHPPEPVEMKDEEKEDDG